jgi:cytochrome c-type biogenesis protein CcmH/NrfG
MGEAIKRAPEDWRNWLVLTRLRAANGDREGALQALRRTRELAPTTSELRTLLGTQSRQ